jgi:hypothetical protein
VAEWYSVSSPDEVSRLVGAWEDAPIENEETCALILETAQEQVLAFAPVLADGEAIPNRWVYAQLKQAENLWNAGRVSSGGDLGIEQYSFTPRPLDKTIKNIIRPQNGRPRVR